MKLSHLALLFVAFAGFVLGLVHLFNLRLASGDHYPPSSSYRADPLGTKAFYESLDPLLSVRRNLQPLARLDVPRDTTLFWLGAEARQLRFTSDEFKQMESFMREGGRLVFASLPLLLKPRRSAFIAPPGTPGALPPAARTNVFFPDDWDPNTTSIQQRWNLAFNHAELTRADDKSFIPELATLRDPAVTGLPRSLLIHTALYFAAGDPAWRTLYARVVGTNDYPVLIERPMGKGSLVLAADGFPFSNEALLRDRHPALLAWFVGASRHVVFDETHLGVSDDPGVAALARKYRLHGLAAALLLLAGLFIWKNTVSFVPPHAEQLARERGDQVQGRDSATGFINLLRRHVPPAEIMKLCLEQWNAHAAHTRKPSREKLEAMQRLIDAENVLEPRQRNPVATYRKFCEILKADRAPTPPTT